MKSDWISAIDHNSSLKQLTKELGAEAAGWIIIQRELRERATKKFGDSATKMLFEREALEQATHPAVSDYHASKFPFGVQVFDLTTGIGGDLLALAKRGPVSGFEIDSVRAEIAQFNANEADVRVEDGFAWLEANQPENVWTDPHRRREGKKLVDPEDYTPNPTGLAKLLARTTLSGMKLSPMLRDDYLESLGGAVEFVSHQGECCEALVWLGNSVESFWGAVHIESGERLQQQDVEDEVDVPEKYLFDSDPAALRAHCLGVFRMPQLGEFPGYLTGDEPINSPWLRCYEVLYSGTGDLRNTKRVLRENNWSVFEMKQRGAGLDASKVVKELKIGGDPVSLVAYKVGKSVKFAIVKRVAF